MLPAVENQGRGLSPLDNYQGRIFHLNTVEISNRGTWGQVVAKAQQRGILLKLLLGGAAADWFPRQRRQCCAVSRLQPTPRAAVNFGR